MCGIAGFSLRPDSKVNARELGHNLLSEIEWRGNMAAGYAYGDGDNQFVVEKGAIRGSQLSLKKMPRDTKTAIFHTRQTTHGTEEVNANNHPVVSPFETIALVHNGVIFNEQEVRWDALKNVKEFLPEVDTSVIGAVIEMYGMEGVGELSGDAAIAWLVAGKANRLNLARLESSPVAYTWLMDGSFVFASTSNILQEALIASDLDYGAVFIMDEQVHFIVQDGVILHHEQTLPMAKFDWGYSSWRKDAYKQVTEGGHPDDFDDKYNDDFSEGYNVYGVGGQDGMWPGEKRAPHGFANVYHDDMDTWEFNEGGDGTFYGEPEETASRAFNKAMALLGDEDRPAHDFRPEYYTVDTDGDLQAYVSLENLEAALVWYAGLHEDDDHYGAEGNARWIEHFQDVGTFEMDGVTTLSWIDDPDDVFNHDAGALGTLDYVREGIGYLKASLGR